MSAAAPVRVAPRSALGSAKGSAHRAESPASRRQAASSRPQLRVVAAPRFAPGPLPFALLVSGVLGAGLVVLLMLHTLAAQDAFTVHRLQRQSAALGDVEQQLAVADQQAQAPSALAARARALGMVPTGSLQIVRHRDGRIVAVASAVPAAVAVPISTSTPSPAATPAGATGRTGTSPTPTPHTSTSAATGQGAKSAAKTPARRRHPH